MLKRLLLWTVPIFIIGVLFYWPMARVLGEGLVGDWAATLTQPRILGIIWLTIWQAAVSTLVCLIMAIPAAYVLYRKRTPGARILRALLTVPFALPTIVTAIGFTVFRRQDVWHGGTPADGLFDSPITWIIAAHIFVNFSVITRTVGSTWVSHSFDVEEAAELAGAGRLRVFFSVSLPELRHAILSSVFTVFMYCTASYGLILVLGGGLINSIETEIAFAANQFLDLQEAGALALLQTLLSIGAFAISSSGMRGRVGFDVQDSDDSKKRVDRRDWPAAVLTLISITLTFAPLALIVSRAFIDNQGQFTLENFINLGGHGARDLLDITLGQAALNSLRNVAVAATLAGVIGTYVAYLLTRPNPNKHSRFITRVLDIAFLLPLGVSTIVLGFGYLITFGSGWLPLRNSWLIVPLIQGLMALPLVVRIVYPALLASSEELGEQASTDGANSTTAFFRIELPLAREAVAAAFGYAAIVSIGEFGAASLLAYGSQATLPTVLYQLISRPGGDNYGMAMAMSAIVIALTFAVVFVASLPARNRTQHRRQPVVAE
ncbi:MAG: ABC transporter permease [Microbacteriaceae bacterium]